KHTNLQYHFAINLIALDGGRPRTVTLKRMIAAWVEHRQDVIIRRTRFMLARDEARMHIIDGLLAAIDVIDAIIALIRAADSSEQAKQQLITQLQFSDRQAQAILDMQLRRLTGLERGKLTAERDALLAAITDYRDILARVERRNEIIKADLTRMNERYGDPRRTVIGDAVGDFDMEDLIEDEPCIVTMTASGYIKRMPVGTFKIQRRGGKGVTGGSLKDEADEVAKVFSATNHQYLLVFTSLGRCYWLKVWQVPEASRVSRGKHLANVLSLDEGEAVTEVIPVREFSESQFLLMATRQGQVKKTELSAYGNPRNGGIKAIKLAEGDDLVDVIISNGSDEVLLATDDGSACRFSETDVRPTGRDTSGVTGIELEPNAKVVSLVRLTPGAEILTVCAKGYGKRTPWEEYRLIRRGGKGVTNINTSERNGSVVASLLVAPGDQIMVTTKKGQVVRMAIDGIRSTGRAAQGVTIVDLEEGDEVGAVALCPRDSETPQSEPPPPAVN
ncbi:MAG: DNA gyrase C-terminal beta-propeller domain-containing protein, partial [Planctomycetota bacterium]